MYSFFEILFFYYNELPRFISRKENTKLPIVGTCRPPPPYHTHPTIPHHTTPHHTTPHHTTQAQLGFWLIEIIFRECAGCYAKYFGGPHRSQFQESMHRCHQHTHDQERRGGMEPPLDIPWRHMQQSKGSHLLQSWCFPSWKTCATCGYQVALHQLWSLLGERSELWASYVALFVSIPKLHGGNFYSLWGS